MKRTWKRGEKVEGRGKKKREKNIEKGRKSGKRRRRERGERERASWKIILHLIYKILPEKYRHN